MKKKIKDNILYIGLATLLWTGLLALGFYSTKAERAWNKHLEHIHVVDTTTVIEGSNYEQER